MSWQLVSTVTSLYRGEVHTSIHWGCRVLPALSYRSKRLTVWKPPRAQVWGNIYLLEERSANDFPSALPKNELYGTSKMAESQKGPLQMVRQKACRQGKHLPQIWLLKDCKLIRPCTINVQRELSISMHQYTNQHPKKSKGYKIFSIHPNTLHSRTKFLFTLNCLCYYFAISQSEFSTKCSWVSASSFIKQIIVSSSIFVMWFKWDNRKKLK